jgi:hypothetical protein
MLWGARNALRSEEWRNALRSEEWRNGGMLWGARNGGIEECFEERGMEECEEWRKLGGADLPGIALILAGIALDAKDSRLQIGRQG